MTSPFRKTLSVGIARIPYRCAVAWFSSTFTLATISLSLSSTAISSRTGESMWQGGHHCAQKSTRTALPSEDDKTRSWNVSSVTLMTLLVVSALLIESPLSDAALRARGQQFTQGSRRVAEVGEALRNPVADILQFRDVPLQVRELAAVRVDGRRAVVARFMPGEQALHERAHVLQREPDRLQRPDLLNEPHVVPVIDAVPVGRTPRRQQPLRLVVAKRPGCRAGLSGQFPYAHCHSWLTPPVRPSRSEEHTSELQSHVN